MRYGDGTLVFFGIVVVVGLAITIIGLTFAQAPKPEDIEAIPVSQVPYVSLTCEQLDTELVILDDRLSALSERQSRHRADQGRPGRGDSREHATLWRRLSLSRAELKP